VHFGDNLLASELLEPNVQQLFTFIETVLSAWVLDEDSDGHDRRRRSRSLQHHKRTPSDVVQLIGSNLNGDRDIGCSRFKHQHWGIEPDGCNAIFLCKVTAHSPAQRFLMCSVRTSVRLFLFRFRLTFQANVTKPRKVG
jgi:hypothetical protein